MPLALVLLPVNGRTRYLYAVAELKTIPQEALNERLTLFLFKYSTIFKSTPNRD